MIPAAFEYVRAGSAAEAVSLIGQHGDDAKFLAGGHSLLPLMKLRLASPSVLVDIGRVSDLSYIRDAGDHVAIGALTRHMDVEKSPLLQQHVPLLAHAASHVGDPQVRHRGTLGGTIAHARHMPGGLFPVNAPAVSHVPRLFATNERLLCAIDAAIGRVFVVAVGAYNVARISTAFDPAWGGERAWVSNRREALPRERRYAPPLRVARGEELMAFHLGSTVVLLLPPGAFEPTERCVPGREIRLGEALARPVRPVHLSAP